MGATRHGVRFNQVESHPEVGQSEEQHQRLTDYNFFGQNIAFTRRFMAYCFSCLEIPPMSFSYPAILLFLWLVPLPGLYILWARRRQKRLALLIVHPNALKGRSGATSNTIFNAQLWLFMSALVLLVIAAAGPRWGQREEIVFGSGRNVLIALDVSRSMLAADVRPNRLERAKADIADLLSELQGDRAGILVFRNRAVLLCPFTTDMAFLSQTLSGISIESAPRGETDIGAAIASALESFKNLGTDHNAIILISDGEDLSGKAASKASEARQRGIPIFCVGIGDAGGATIPDETSSAMKYRGEDVVTKLNNQTLLDIATASGGAYIPLQTSATGRNTLGTLYQRHVKSIMARELQEMRESRLIERFQIFLFPGLILILLSTALSLGRPSRKRRMAKASATALIIIALSPLAFCQQETLSPPTTATPAIAGTTATTPMDKVLTAHQISRLAQRAWNQGEFGQAAILYDSALSQEPIDPELEKTMRFNAALAYLKAGNAGQAAELFRKLAVDKAAGAEAAEGLGVSLFRAADALAALQSEEAQPPPDPNSAQPEAAKPKRNLADEKLKLLEESAAAFQLAMRGLPGNDQRRKNLEAALAEIPKLREEARIAGIINKYGEMSPEDLIKELLAKQRRVYSTSAGTFTNNSPEQIRLLENAAKQQRETADIWMPLHQKMLEAAQKAITNAHDLADFKYKLDAAKDQAEGASDALANLDPSAMEAMRSSESTALQLLSMTAPPPLVLAESMLAQSNALSKALDPAKPRQPMQDQQLSSGLFQLFADRYGPWLDQQQQQNQVQDPTSNPQAQMPQAQQSQLPDMTPEVRKEIDDLVSQTIGSHSLVQMDVLPNDVVLSDKARINAEQALKNMLRILELLPKPPQQQQQKQDKQDQQKQDQQKQDQDKQDQDKQDQDKQDQQKDEKKSEEEQKQEQQQPEEEQPKEEQQQQAEAQQTKESPDQKEAEKIMAQILEQEKQREEDRRKRMRTLPPRVGERDW